MQQFTRGGNMLRGTFVQSYFFSCANRCVPYSLYGGIRDTLCWHDKDLDKDTEHDEGCAGYGELRRGFSLDE